MRKAVSVVMYISNLKGELKAKKTEGRKEGRKEGREKTGTLLFIPKECDITID